MNKKLTITAWALYDFANTSFAMNIVSLYFALWVTVQMKAKDIFYALALAISVLVVSLLIPVFGVFSDRSGRRAPYLLWFTLFCVALTIVLGLTHSLFLGLVVFIFANIFYQLAAVFYNALLPQITPLSTLGRISSLGVGLSYLGTIASLPLVRYYVAKGTYQSAFIPTAIFFLVFSLPCFFLVRDANIKTKEVAATASLRGVLGRYKKTWKDMTADRRLFNFMISTFIALNAINTVIVFMSVYSKKVIALSDANVNTFFIISAFFAIIGSLASGFICDHWGAKKTLCAVYIWWIAALILAMASFKEQVFWIVGALAGMSLGATWVVTRALAIQIIPQERMAEYLGVYGLTGKFSSIFGPLVWGLITFKMEFLGMVRYRVAIFSLICFIVVGLVYLTRVKEEIKIQAEI